MRFSRLLFLKNGWLMNTAWLAICVLSAVYILVNLNLSNLALASVSSTWNSQTAIDDGKNNSSPVLSTETSSPTSPYSNSNAWTIEKTYVGDQRVFTGEASIIGQGLDWVSADITITNEKEIWYQVSVRMGRAVNVEGLSILRYDSVRNEYYFLLSPKGSSDVQAIPTLPGIVKFGGDQAWVEFYARSTGDDVLMMRSLDLIWRILFAERIPVSEAEVTLQALSTGAPGLAGAFKTYGVLEAIGSLDLDRTASALAALLGDAEVQRQIMHICTLCGRQIPGGATTFQALALGTRIYSVLRADWDLLLAPPSDSVVFKSHVPSSIAIQPGGIWISPGNETSATHNVRLSAKAYPSNPGEPAIDRVEFTTKLPGSSTWTLVSTLRSPSHDDFYEYDWNLSGIPMGQVQLSFDVYDKAGNKNLAPNGTRTITHQTSSLTSYQVPQLLSPNDGITLQANQSTTFSWSNTGASQYKFEAWNDTGSGSASYNVNGTTTQFAPAYAGSWRWQVRSISSSGQVGDAPHARSFTVTSALSANPGVPQLLSPNDGITLQTNQNATFTWSNTGASQYRFEIWNDDGDGDTANVVTGTSTQFAPAYTGSWRWQVRSISSTGQVGDAPHTRSFTVVGTSQPSNGIELCDGTNYGQPSIVLTEGKYSNLADYSWSDRIESIRFLGNYKGNYHVVLCSETNFGGDPGHYDADSATLGNAQTNHVRSIEIYKKSPGSGIILYDGENYSGASQFFAVSFPEAKYADLGSVSFSDRAESIKFVGDLANELGHAVLHSEKDFQGDPAHFEADAATLPNAQKNHVRSITLYKVQVPEPPKNPNPANGTVLSDSSGSLNISFEGSGDQFQIHIWGKDYDRVSEWNSSRSIHLDGLASGQTYSWQARGKNKAGEGPWSPEWKFMTSDITVSDSKNLAPNASFELGGNLPDGWVPQVRGTDAVLTWQVDPTRTGQRSLGITASQSALSGWPGWQTAESIPIDTSKTYEFSVYYLVKEQGLRWLDIDCLNSSGQWVGGVSTGTTAVPYEKNTWQIKTLNIGPEDFSMFNGVTRVKLGLRLSLNYSSGGINAGTKTEIFYDDISFEEKNTSEQQPATPSPTTSPTAGKLCFVSSRDGNWNIYTMNPDGSDTIRLTTQGANSQPQWSPDGSKIVFWSDRDGNYEIYTMNADGSGQTRFTVNTAYDFDPAWSPDGSKIVFTSMRDGPWDIYVMNADGSNQIRLTNGGEMKGNPRFSPDSSKIAYEYGGGGANSAIYIMNVDGSNPTKLIDNSNGGGTFGWSPDGEKIAFTSKRDGKWGIFLANADGSNLIRLTTNSPDVDPGNPGPTWSPDGSQIAYRDGKAWNTQIFVMNSDGTAKTQITNNAYDNFGPAWLPSGEKYAASVSGIVRYSTTPLNNVKVDLLEGEVTNSPLKSTTTNIGYYSFSNVPDGSYWVGVHGPSSEYLTWIAYPIDVQSQDVSQDIALPKNIDLLTPSSGAVVNSLHPQLTWQPNSEASLYKIELYITDGWQEIENGTSTSSSYIVQRDLVPGVNYTWQVTAFDSQGIKELGCVGCTQDAFSFTIETDSLATAVQSLFIDNSGVVQKDTSISSTDGLLTLEISGNTKITSLSNLTVTDINVTSLDIIPQVPSNSVILLAYTFGPDGTEFYPALKIVISYDSVKLPSGVTGEDLYTAVFDGTQWQKIESIVDTTTMIVTAEASHFSNYALMANIPNGQAVVAPTVEETKTTDNLVKDTSNSPWFLIAGLGASLLVAAVAVSIVWDRRKHR
jgi:Tol biopolymer transport system component